MLAILLCALILPADTVNGRVIDTGGQPVSQAIVEIPELGRSVTATDAGAFHLVLGPGRYTLTVRRHGYARLSQPSVDTCGLARRLVRDEVPNCKLSTLAERFRLGHRPTHRALDDALATGDLLHVLLERAGSLGVLGLDDLLSLPKLAGHPQLAKLRLTDDLPRVPGVYLFRDAGGRVLYVGKASNLRTRVRSYFSGDERRKIGQLLRETHRIDHVVAPGPLEAAVLEVRLIHEHLPRFNRQAKTWRRYAYLKLTLNERFPRLSVVKVWALLKRRRAEVYPEDVQDLAKYILGHRIWLGPHAASHGVTVEMVINEIIDRVPVP